MLYHVGYLQFNFFKFYTIYNYTEEEILNKIFTSNDN